MPYSKPNWILLKECGEKLINEGKTPFSRKQLIDCVREENPNRKKSSLRPMIQGMTVNLKGGAPGGIGKNIFYQVSRGLFELYDPSKHGPVSKGAAVVKASKHKEIPAHRETKSTEDEIRDFIMQILYERLGRDGSWEGSGKTASFELREYRGYKCFAEQPLLYTLPTKEQISHASDILIINKEKDRYISIEIKYRSAVTDQFKCRSYDMIHLKKSYQDNLLGIMIFVKSTTGISIKHAKSICYSFDHFFGIREHDRFTPNYWDPVISSIRKFLE